MSPVWKFSAPGTITTGRTLYTSMLAGNTVFNPWAPSGAYDSIATTTASGSSAVLSFTSIPSTYTHLQIRLSGGTTAGLAPAMTFNGDTGANYTWHRLSGNGTAASAGSSAPRNNISIAPNAGLLAVTSEIFSPAIVDILDYTSTTKNKTVRAIAGWDGNGSGYLDFSSGLWFATPAAITSITLTMAANWIAGSTAALYGIKGA